VQANRAAFLRQAGLPCTHHAPKDVLQTAARFAQRAIKTILGCDLLFGCGKALLAGRFHAHRIPSHGDIRAQLRAFIVIAQTLARNEQSLVNMAARMEPAERRFSQIDSDGATFALSA